MSQSPISLPEPDADARAHSARLSAVIRERINAAGGWLNFADYMRAALYEPGLGYYSAGAHKFGESGDFVTAPEISPLFSRCVASQCAQVLGATGGDTVLELGAGTGRMAADMLLEFERLGQLPTRYCVLETSADLRARQRATLASLPDELAGRVSWLERLPDKPIQGVILGNEVVDALPVQRFIAERGAVFELGVTLEDGRFADAMRPADAELEAFVAGLHVGDDGAYSSERNPQLKAWLAGLGDALETGVVMLFDYGFSAREYYLPERRSGTLRCYYRHRAHEDPYFWPGLQDITAWVDFTALAEAAPSANLSVSGYTTQAQFLLAAGIEAQVANASAKGPQQQVELASGLRKLMLPGEMGDAIKVMGLTRGDAVLPNGFSGRDMRSSL